ncbi:MAG: FixH family protein [Actinomycetota bacterium]
MTTQNITIALAVALLLTSAALASPLKVKTQGTKSQTVTMCAECKGKVSCAQVGDYTIGLDANLEYAKLNSTVLSVQVLDTARNPVTDARVVATLSMPNHKHGSNKPLTLKHAGHGRYIANTKLVMTGAWRAEVAVTPASGDTVKQTFVITR